jgi:hypothetical protein
LDGLGGGLDKLDYVIGVGNHRHVVRRDFDGGGTHPRGEPALGIGRDGLIALHDQESGRQANRSLFTMRQVMEMLRPEGLQRVPGTDHSRAAALF